ncbi:hypothetical protein ABT173_34660 [Streptomyces sp. NPDC001795]|uniref:hypothetical protein n=1 Tax=unclassified Streptomyces TaxID=2593676 RepID=UPI00332FF045
MSGSAPHLRHEQLEHRLRAALDAKARSVDVIDLRPAFPPSERVRPRIPARRVALFGLGLGLVAMAACVLLAVLGRQPFGPVEPARPSQSQSGGPSTPVAGEPSPSPSAPSGMQPDRSLSPRTSSQSPALSNLFIQRQRAGSGE